MIKAFDKTNATAQIYTFNYIKLRARENFL